jgi:hypothetical protein
MITGLNTTFFADKQLGNKNEILMLPKLKCFFEDDSIKQLDEYNKNDFIGSNGTSYELKARRIRRNQFKTTFMPVNKVIADKMQYFVFRFTDGDSYIKFDPVKFSTYETQMLTDGRAGKNGMQKLHYHIPVADLTDF